jgi:transposase
MSANGMVRPCSCPARDESGKGLQRQRSTPCPRTSAVDFRDAEAIAEAVERPTMKFVATKTADQLDLQALHRVRERLVSQRTGIINQIRAFLLERGVPVRQGLRFLSAELPNILAAPHDALSARIVRVNQRSGGRLAPARWADR